MRESGAFSKIELDFFRAGEALEMDGDLDGEATGSTYRPPRPATEPPADEDDGDDEWEWKIAIARARAS